MIQMPQIPGTMPPKAAAGELRISDQTVYRLIAQGDLPAWRRSRKLLDVCAIAVRAIQLRGLATTRLCVRRLTGRCPAHCDLER
jgi:excisionase family DNA binding protein